MGDPLFAHGVDATAVGIVILKAVIVFVILLVGVLFMIWYERKVISWMQNRYGPNRTGPYGLLQSLADGVKVFFKELFVPARADRRSRVPGLQHRPCRWHRRHCRPSHPTTAG